jgi:two-component system NtrC family sensor kinase
LEVTQAQMLHSEKMASIGQLAAGVAHEINNPTGFISSNLKTMSDYQEGIGELLVKYHELVSILEKSSENSKA